MLDFFIQIILVTLTLSALLAAITYPIQIFKYYEHMHEWSNSNNKRDQKKLLSYMLLAFIGMCVLIFSGIKVFLWWIPDGPKTDEFLSSRDSATLAIAFFLTGFLFEYLYKLPKKLNDLRLFNQDLEKIKSDVRAEVEGRNTITDLLTKEKELQKTAKELQIENEQLLSTNVELNDEIQELLTKNKDLKIDVGILGKENERLRSKIEKKSNDDKN